MRLSHVYLIGPPSGEAVKVGVAVNPAARLSSLQIGCWQELKLLRAVCVPASVARDVEALAHKRLAQFRARGEWFAVGLDHAYYVILGAARDVVHRVGTRNRLDLCNHICLAGEPETVIDALSSYAALRRDKGADHIDAALLGKLGVSSFGTFLELCSGAKDIRAWLIENPRFFDEVEVSLVAALKALVEMKWDLRPDDMAELLQAANA